MISLLLTILRNLADGIKQLNSYYSCVSLWKCPTNICFHKLMMLWPLLSVQCPVNTQHDIRASARYGKFPNPQFDISVWQLTAPVFSDWNCPVPSPCSARSMYQEISWTIVAISSPNPNRIFIQHDVWRDTNQPCGGKNEVGCRRMLWSNKAI